ncbi:MAG: dihydrodipicolinate synthase family protein [Lachnospiraceae bacterium]|nr:dihydrodipicolinate synthase family protein [Lachnospiraceae bacterium]
MKKMYVASITPFDKENKIDEIAMKKLWDKNITQGADGFFIGGSAGECFLLSQNERIRTFEIAAQHLKNSDVFAHVGSTCTQEAVEYAKQAKSFGITRIAAVPPFYFGFSPKEVAGYYYDIAEAADMPVLYYNIPGSTHWELDLSNPEMKALFKSGAIGAVKHTNLNLYQFERIKAMNPEIKCFGGYENCMIAFLAFGVDGFIGSSFNFMLPQYKKVMELYLNHKEVEARILEEKANNVLDFLLKNGLCAGLKFAVSHLGIEAGKPRKPMLPYNEKTEDILINLMKENLE